MSELLVVSRRTTASLYEPDKWGDHREAAQVIYDPEIITYEKLVRHVYATIDYEDGEGQFCDRGRSYSPAIYYKTESERLIKERLAPKNLLCQLNWASSTQSEEHQISTEAFIQI